jgi:hypothetical protein
VKVLLGPVKQAWPSRYRADVVLPSMEVSAPYCDGKMALEVQLFKGHAFRYICGTTHHTHTDVVTAPESARVLRRGGLAQQRQQ